MTIRQFLYLDPTLVAPPTDAAGKTDGYTRIGADGTFYVVQDGEYAAGGGGSGGGIAPLDGTQVFTATDSGSGTASSGGGSYNPVLTGTATTGLRVNPITSSILESTTGGLFSLTVSVTFTGTDNLVFMVTTSGSPASGKAARRLNSQYYPDTILLPAYADPENPTSPIRFNIYLYNPGTTEATITALSVKAVLIAGDGSTLPFVG